MKKVECEVSDRWLEINDYVFPVMCGNLISITLKTKNEKGRRRTICTSIFKLEELKEALNKVEIKNEGE